ncbi:TPA: tyrosine-type recombinase/integrase [Streptococcus suis]
MKYTKTKYPNIFTYETQKGLRYYVRRGYFVNGDKKEFTKSGLRSLKDAQRILRDIEERIYHDEMDVNLELTLNEYWEIYSAKKEKTGQWNDTSIYTNAGIYRTMIKEKWGNLPLKKINRNDYEEHLAEMLGQYRRNSVLTSNRLLNSILNDAVKNGNLRQNKLSGIYLGESELEPLNKELKIDDFQTWIKTAEELLSTTHFAFVYLTIFGLRRGEVCGIRFMDVTFDSNNRAVLNIRDSRSNRTKDGAGRTKTESSVRYVVLNDRGSELLLQIMETAKQVKKKADVIVEQEKDYLSIRIKNNKYYLERPAFLNKIFKRVSEECGIYITPHIMRHFFTTQSLIAGARPEDVMQFLGHASLQTTKQYTHIKEERAHNVTDLFDKKVL